MRDEESPLPGSSGAADPVSADAVEVTRAGDGVLLRAGPGAPAVRVSAWGWADFVAAVAAGEFEATLHSGNTFRTSEVTPAAADVVEVTRADDGVLLRVRPGAHAVHVSRRAWSGFLAGICRGAFDDTLPGVGEDPPARAAGAADVEPAGGSHVFAGQPHPVDCAFCGHPFVPHVFVGRVFGLFTPPGGPPVRVPEGGTASCPEPGCGCAFTWSLWVRGRDRAGRPPGRPPVPGGSAGAGAACPGRPAGLL